jgi:hypothetical protein
MINKIFLGMLAFFGVIFLISMLYRGSVIPPDSIITPGTAPEQPIALPGAPLPSAGEVTLMGEATCLPHRGNPAVSTMECAYGFRDSNGYYYGVRDTSADLHVISQLQMNSPMKVKGVFIPKRDETYESIGILEIKTIEMGITTEEVSLTGTFMCLPHTNKDVPQTEECAFGFKTDSGDYYAANFGASQHMMQTFQNGDHVTVKGFITPLEEISANTWQNYPIKGIFTIHQ